MRTRATIDIGIGIGIGGGIGVGIGIGIGNCSLVVSQQSLSAPTKGEHH